jgi:threonine/homoserine/homoserine lactone efflux protein
MPDSSTLLLFTAAALALLIVPGPSVLYIVARGIDQGRGAALASSFGVGAGSFVHTIAATLGLSALLATSATAFTVVKYLGAAYLIFLGVQTLLTRPEATSVAPRASRSLGRIFLQGVVVEMLSPKVALFYLAFLPQFVDPARGSVAAQTLLLGGLMVGLGIVTDGIYALVAGSAGSWLKRNRGYLRAQRYVSASIYLGLGVTTALTGSRNDS